MQVFSAISSCVGGEDAIVLHCGEGDISDGTDASIVADDCLDILGCDTDDDSRLREGRGAGVGRLVAWWGGGGGGRLSGT